MQISQWTLDGDSLTNVTDSSRSMTHLLMTQNFPQSFTTIPRSQKQLLFQTSDKRIHFHHVWTAKVTFDRANRVHRKKRQSPQKCLHGSFHMCLHANHSWALLELIICSGHIECVGGKGLSIVCFISEKNCTSIQLKNNSLRSSLESLLLTAVPCKSSTT